MDRFLPCLDHRRAHGAGSRRRARLGCARGPSRPSSSSTALVTGASSGIGAAIARELAGRGHNLTLVARREERLRELAAELAERAGVRAETIAADLGDEAERDAARRRGRARSGSTVEILVNSAGFGGSATCTATTASGCWRWSRLNCEALLDLQARYSPAMADRGRGAIINIASTAAFQPMPGNAAYAATKAFVLSLSEATHAELARLRGHGDGGLPGAGEDRVRRGRRDRGRRGAAARLLWTPVEDVARAAVEGAERGKRVVVPGLLNRAGAISGQHAPRALALPLAKRIWRRAL